jgi:mannosyl-3-phosphoglycerate phosphatase
MKSNLTLMVFTDLDGTLIDHDTYRWDAASQALNRLAALSCGVVLASSKTAAEVSALRAELGLEAWPAIVENGAGLLPPNVTNLPDATQYTQIRAALSSLPASMRTLFRGFGDLTDGGVAAVTGLSRSAALLAKNRAFSEPGQWLGTETEKADFLAQLSKNGITAQQGGRFLTLSYGRNKADQMRVIMQDYLPRHTVALGDAPNDIEMLQCAEFGVIIANRHRAPLPALQGEDAGKITRTKEAGPVGWNRAILTLIDQLALDKDDTHG